jgi:c-di-GMP-binding flagellar brake protein YcgR
VEAEAAGKILHYEARNISIGGMLLRGNDTLEDNQTFRMTFPLPGYGSVRATGIVQHASPGAFMGVRFLEISAEAKFAVEQYVKQTPALEA